jgi:hypothetical protein
LGHIEIEIGWFIEKERTEDDIREKTTMMKRHEKKREEYRAREKEMAPSRKQKVYGARIGMSEIRQGGGC